MDSADYSYGEAATNLPDKTAGGVSKLAGITFGTEEDSFHSDEFDRELGKALAVGTTRRQQLKKGKDRFLGHHHPTSPDDHPEGSPEDSERSGSGQRAQRNVTAPKTFNNNNHPTKTPSRLASRTNPITRNPSDRLSPIAARNVSSKRKASRVSTGRFPNGKASPDPGELNGPEDSNLSSVHQTLNDSAAFALSPPMSPEISRSTSNGGGIAGKKLTTAGGVPKRSLASDASRSKGAHLTLREQEKVIDEVKKENFNLKLKIYFLEDRLAKLAPDQVDLALKENVEIKVEFQTVRQELKRYKRLLLEAERAIAQAKAERDEVLLQQTFEAQNEPPRRQDEQTIRRLEAELRQMKEQLANANQSSITTVQSSHQSTGNSRPALKNQHIEDWVKEEHMLEIKNLKSELTEERQSKEDLLADHQDLKHQLIEAQNALQDTRYAIGRSSRADFQSDSISHPHSRLSDRDEYPSRKSTTTPASTAASAHRIKDLKKEVDDVYAQMAILEDENASLRSQINAQVTMLTTRNTEKEKLQDQVHSLKRQMMELEEEIQRGDCAIENIQNRQNVQVEDDELREELNMYRDKLASALLNLEKREKEIDELNLELQERETMYAQQMEQVNQECTVDLDSAKAEMDHLQDLVEEREYQLEQLGEQLHDIVTLQETTDKTLREKSAKLEEKVLDYEAVLHELEATQADLKDRP
ncbi:hypothetical protein CROQUDRAFT_401337 [Cronartium quercuum f. sp. fusiforme G11]|uniref:Centrosomin N-terminal motif 1 domain-containing protein n=1 Tax=Cronartium quercuum f. sp. fusiforme G11 TaxID=708437 RepID=A0A9P6NR58_9BASI|nr:hypothetical protein CROQUDRAFT_401337 [Cronartium quercuum f. sp. fusiforme G11]